MTAIAGTKPEETLIARLKTATGSYKVVWPNVAVYQPVIGTPYYRAMFLPVPPQRLTHGKADRHIGIFQIDVVYPAKQGLLTVLSAARAIASHFDRYSVTDADGYRIRVIKPPAVNPHQQDIDWYAIPVSITYEILN